PRPGPSRPSGGTALPSRPGGRGHLFPGCLFRNRGLARLVKEETPVERLDRIAGSTLWAGPGCIQDKEILFMIDRIGTTRLFRPIPAGPARSRRSRRLGLELLEDRLAPATLTVNSTADTANPSDPYLSLREAIAIVNSPTLPDGLSDQILAQIDGALHGDGRDSIVFDPSQVSGPIVLGGSPLTLNLPGSTASITIDGGSGVTVDGNQLSGGFSVNNGVQATLDHLTLTHGHTLAAGGSGISNGGTLMVTNCIITANSAFQARSLLNLFSSPLTISNSTISSNSGGGIFNIGALTVTNSTISANSGSDGAGIYTQTGSLTVTNSTISNNSAALGSFSVGGGISIHGSTVTV